MIDDIDISVATEEILALKVMLNNKKSSGVDGISSHVLKKFHTPFWDYSAAILTACLKEGYFQRRWKGTIIPIPMKQTVNKRSNKSAQNLCKLPSCWAPTCTS